MVFVRFYKEFVVAVMIMFGHCEENVDCKDAIKTMDEFFLLPLKEEDKEKFGEDFDYLNSFINYTCSITGKIIEKKIMYSFNNIICCTDIKKSKKFMHTWFERLISKKFSENKPEMSIHGFYNMFFYDIFLHHIKYNEDGHYSYDLKMLCMFKQIVYNMYKKYNKYNKDGVTIKNITLEEIYRKSYNWPIGYKKKDVYQSYYETLGKVFDCLFVDINNKKAFELEVLTRKEKEILMVDFNWYLLNSKNKKV